MADFYSDIIVRVAVFLYALWIGGLATTIFNRVPNEIPIGPTQKPRCNNCGNEIKFKYFFPVLGYFFSNGKCIHCGMCANDCGAGIIEMNADKIPTIKKHAIQHKP